MPRWPCSEAGSKIVATTRRIAPAFSARNSSSARITATGCAVTHGPGCKSGGSDLSALALDPQRAHAGSGFVFQRAGEIDDGAAGIAGALPVLARALFIGGEESEIHMLELLGAHALDEADLVAHGFELAQRLVVVEQAHVHRGKIALVEHFGNFFALERGGADDGGTVKIARASGGMRRRRVI